MIQAEMPPLLTPVDTFSKLGTTLLPLVAQGGILLATNPVLFVRLCRLLKEVNTKHKEASGTL